MQVVVAAHLGDLPQVRDRVDDQRGQHRLGQVLEQRCEHEHRDQDQQRGDQRRHLGAGTRALVDRRLRKAAATREPAKQSRAGVRDAQRYQLLVGIDLVSVLRREVVSGAERLAEDHEQQPGSGRDQRDDVAAVQRRDARRRQSARDVAHDLHPPLGETKSGADEDPQNERQQPAWDLRCQPLDREQQHKRAGAHRERRSARVPQMPNQVDELLDRVAGPLLDPEQLRQLTDGHEDRQPEHEPLHHRPRQELRHEPEPQKSRDQEQAATEDHQPRGVGHVTRRVRPREPADRGGEQHRGRRRRGCDQVTACAEHRVGSQRHQQRVQPGLRWKPRQPGVRDRLGNEQAPYGRAGDHVEPQPLAIVFRQPLEDGHEAPDARRLRRRPRPRVDQRRIAH